MAWREAVRVVAGVAGLALAGWAAEALLGPDERPAVRGPDPVVERIRRDREAGRERDRARAGEEEAERAGRVERLGPALEVLSPDRRLWVGATPEGMALEWARRARPGNYRVESARKLMYVLVATLEDPETGRQYGLRAEMLPGSDEAKLALSEMGPGP